MRYELKIPAIHGDVIPLCLVAEAMARAASTAYGKTPPHKPIFDYQLPTQIGHLLNEARAGRLHVCNQDGVQGAADEIIAAAKSSGDLSEVHRYLVEPDWEKLHRDNPPVVAGVDVRDFSGLDLGATEIDWDATIILILYSKLHCLNEWGETRGDSFFISDEPVGWVDERGYMNPTDAPAAKVEAGAGTTTNDNEPDNEEIHRGLDGAPSLKKGKNSRDKVDAWVKWQAKERVKPNDTLTDLLDRIRLEANKWGYESERKPFTNEIIRKMLPPKITGGRGKNRGKSKK